MKIIYLRNDHKKKEIRRAEYKQAVRSFRRKNQKNPTKAELSFSNKLDSIPIHYEFQKMFNVGTKKKPKYKIVDFYLPQYHLVIEIDGGYHNSNKQSKKDFIREQLLIKKSGIHNIVRFTNWEAENLSVDKIINRIDSYYHPNQIKTLPLRTVKSNTVSCRSIAPKQGK